MRASKTAPVRSNKKAVASFIECSLHNFKHWSKG